MKAVFENKEQNILVKHIRGFQRFLPAFHDHVEILLILSGSIRVSIGENQRVLQPGEMSVCFPYQIHSYEESADAEVLLVLFPSKAVDVFGDALLKVCPVNPYWKPEPYFVTLLQRLLAHSNQPGREEAELTKVYICAIVGELLQQIPMNAVKEKDTNAIQKLLLYCQEHYLQNVSVASAAKAVNISQSYVTKIFATEQKCAFRTYINRLRVMDVKKLLVETNRTITDIMLTCGFNNQSTFNRVFQEETGMSPREYRKFAKGATAENPVSFADAFF